MFPYFIKSYNSYSLHRQTGQAAGAVPSSIASVEGYRIKQTRVRMLISNVSDSWQNGQILLKSVFLECLVYILFKDLRKIVNFFEVVI